MSDKSSNLATLATNIKEGVANALKDLHTSMPGIVVSFDAATQLASVQPAIKRIFKTDDGEKELLTPTNLPVLINVLVQFPRGGGFSMTFPVAQGDECLLVFCERSIDSWHQYGTVREPGARRFHSLSDATAFVGLSSVPNKVPGYDAVNTVIKKDDGSVSISLNADGSLAIGADSDIDIIGGAEVNIEAATVVNITGGTEINMIAPIINLDGVVNALQGLAVTGSCTNEGTNIGKQHIHSQGPDSPSGDSQQDTGFPHS